MEGIRVVEEIDRQFLLLIFTAQKLTGVLRTIQAAIFSCIIVVYLKRRETNAKYALKFPCPIPTKRMLLWLKNGFAPSCGWSMTQKRRLKGFKVKFPFSVSSVRSKSLRFILTEIGIELRHVVHSIVQPTQVFCISI